MCRRGYVKIMACVRKGFTAVTSDSTYEPNLISEALTSWDSVGGRSDDHEDGSLDPVCTAFDLAGWAVGSRSWNGTPDHRTRTPLPDGARLAGLAE